MTRHKRNEQTKRQWRILQALNDCRWWTIDEVSDAAGVTDRHRRTVMRDLEALMYEFCYSEN